MKFVVARRTGRRGEGLGNEIIAWSKGYIASQVLGARLVGPAWGINARQYYRNFGTSRLDVVAEEVLTRISTHRFTEEDYRSIGEVDFGKAIRVWSERLQLAQRASFVVTVDGMYGGYLAIKNARPFLWSKLLGSRNALRNIYAVQSQLNPEKLLVAVHLRVGSDFAEFGDNPDCRGRFNMKLPMEWYLNLCRSLREAFQDRIQFHFFTDKIGPAFQEAVREFNPQQQPRPNLSEASDLALMAMADLRICSVSSYSLVASFLSGGLYTWYEPQLTLLNGLYSLWGSEPTQMQEHSPIWEAGQRARSSDAGSSEIKGWPIGMTGELPGKLLEALERRLNALDRRRDLLFYGVVPQNFEKMR